MKEFRDYDITIPDLVYDIVNYFRASNNIKALAKKSILDYCMNSKFSKTPEAKGEIVQPDVVLLICENLVKKRYLNCIKYGAGAMGMDANYIFLCQNDKLFLSKPDAFVFSLNCMAYGFPYIYNAYKNIVLPVIVKNAKGDIEMGTCFRFNTGILTAKHCLTAEEVSIQGYTADQLKQCPVIISRDDEYMDMAYIELGEQSPIFHDEANVLDEVLAMGYPKIPMFNEFCTAERASVSSIATKGAVASLANQYMTPSVERLMLITARIRGGNSGGPIINEDGAVVGVAFAEPFFNGNYDDMGYGIAYPISVYFQMLEKCATMKVNFVDEVK